MRYLSKLCNYRRAAAVTRVFHLECALHHVRWSRHIVRLHKWVGPSLFRDRRGRPMTWIHRQVLGQRIEPCQNTLVQRVLAAAWQGGPANAPPKEGVAREEERVVAEQTHAARRVPWRMN